MTEPIHVISLGAGVQSSTMALMAAAGEITPMPVAAVFADTGDEPLDVYLWLSHLKELLPFPVYTVQSHHGKLSDNLTKGDHSQIPAYFLTSTGTPTIGKRQCTNHWKVRPVRKKCRELSEGGAVILWQGISTDEVSRCKDSGAIWLVHRFPLIEAGVNRNWCVNWLKRNGHEAPKSACCYCPYRSDAQWRKSKQDPTDWALIKRVDGILNKRGEFLHPSCRPIADVDFSTEEERGQLNMFNNECEGMCGV